MEKIPFKETLLVLLVSAMSSKVKNLCCAWGGPWNDPLARLLRVVALA